MATPALNIPIRVTGDDDFKKKMNETSSLVAHTTRAVASQVIRMNAEWLASQGAAGAAALAFGRVLRVLGPVALAVVTVKDMFALMSYATRLATARIEEFNAVSAKANAAGFSVELFQRITTSAGDSKTKVDELTEALTKFNAASQPKLGGSDLQRRLDELKDAGNLGSNSGLTALAAANTAEERLRAVVSLIGQMLEKGEQTAALDIAERAFGSKMRENLQQDSGYLDQMLQKADAMSKAQIVSEADVSRAIQLKERIEGAEKILSDRWKPVQEDIATLGMNYRENWANIVEALASAVGLATQLYTALKGIPDVLAGIGNASIWDKITAATGALGLNSDPASLGIAIGPSLDRENAEAKLRAALLNHANVTRAMGTTTSVATAVRGDTSKAPGSAKKEASEQANAYDRATEALAKHTAKMEADAKAVGLGSGALEELRAKAQLMAAAQQAGIPITDAMRAKIDQLAASARQAGEALAKAKIDSSTEFQSRTALLAPEDAAIAERLKPMFGNDVPAALASSQAAAMRFNGALKQVSTSISGSLESGLLDLVSGTKSVGDAFRDLGAVVIREIERMIIKLLIVGPLMKALSRIGGGLLGGATGGLGGIGGMGLSLLGTGGLFADGGEVRGPGGPRDDRIPIMASNGEFVVRADATARHLPLLHAINQNRIPKFADGGMIGLPANDNRFASNDNRTSFAPTINVKVEGGSRGMQADEALAKQIGAQVEASVRNVVAKELRTQTRPGGLLKR